MELRIYSPTETEDFLVCPRLRVLKRQWHLRGGSWTPHLALGNAIHAGLAANFTNIEAASRGVYGAVNIFAVAADEMARGFREGSEWTLEGLQKLTEKGLKLALTTELVSPEGSVIGVERWVAHSRLDLITREPFGIQVTDHKVSLSLEKRKLEYKLRDLDPSWQLLHQAWAVRQEFGECPKWARAHMIVLGPRPFTHIHSVGPLDDKRLDDFERSGEYHWDCMGHDANGYGVDREMELTSRVLPPMNTRSCSNQYGRKCDYYDGCHLYGGDLTKFPALYSEGEREWD
jgi:hypothetical protein